MKEQNLSFEFSIEEINLLLESLAQLPFKRVIKIYSKIEVNANNQLNEIALKQKELENNKNEK